MGQELTSRNILEGIDDDSLRALDLDDLRRTIRRAAVVDEPRDATLLRRINDRVLVDSEEVTGANTLQVVLGLAEIGDALSDLLTYVFDDHVVDCDVLLS